MKPLQSGFFAYPLQIGRELNAHYGCIPECCGRTGMLQILEVKLHRCRIAQHMRAVESFIDIFPMLNAPYRPPLVGKVGQT